MFCGGQASRLVRQRFVNDLAGVAISIWYDWQDDGSHEGSGGLNREYNFGPSSHRHLCSLCHHRFGLALHLCHYHYHHFLRLACLLCTGTLENVQSANASYPLGLPKLAYSAALVSTAMLGNCSFDARLLSSSAGSFALAYICPPSARNTAGTSFVSVVWDPNMTLWNVSEGRRSTILLPPSQAGHCFAVQDINGVRVGGRVCAEDDGRDLVVKLRSDPQYLIPLSGDW